MRHSLTILLILIFGVLLPRFANAELPELICELKSVAPRTYLGWDITPANDQNDDGFDDVFVYSVNGTYLFLGGNPMDSVRVMCIDSLTGRMSNVGDVNDDGFADFADNGRTPSSWRLNLYHGGPSLDSIRDLWFGRDDLRPFGPTVNGKDFNFSGNTELVSRTPDDHSVAVFELGADSDSLPDLLLTPANLIWDGYVFGEQIIGGDFNGDGYPDLGVNLRRNPPPQQYIKGSVYLYWGGPGFDTVPDLIIREPGEFEDGMHSFGSVTKSLGDVNGDGFDDLYAGAGVAWDDTVGFVYFGGPDIDTFPDVTIANKHSEAAAAGDINNDGYDDLMTSYPTPYSGWGYVDIYYGGPDMDSLRDIRIDISDMPGYHLYFGMDIDGVGDVNGDGIDDFALSSFTQDSYSAVYIFAGAGSATDVGDNHWSLLPADFKLHQNYPNPFNPTTTIEFNVPARGEVKLTIYNILGREIRTLLNKELPPGAHTATWNGRTNTGERAPSGIYLYRISTEGFEQARKMVLLK